MRFHAISKLFYAESICVAGASTKELSIGYELLKTIKVFGYKGKLYPVNPKADEVLGFKCYHSISEIKDKIDLGIVVVPKQFAFDSIKELLIKGVKSIILITAGFKEVDENGEFEENRILKLIRDFDAVLVGPNCMGVINTSNELKLNATFVAETPQNGKMGFLSQSGALGAAVLNSLRETDIKFAHFISVGNKADIDENDILEFWESDPNIGVITMYLESFEDGNKFIKAFINNKISKPVIVLKAGKTEAGSRAASSHTGALSSSDLVVNSLLKQFGVIRVNDLNEMFNTAKGFESFHAPKGNRVAIVTNAGGPAILAVDSLEPRGLALAEFSEKTKIKLREFVHPAGSINNPIDLLPGGNADVYKIVNEIVVNDENVDSVISIFVEPVMVNPLPVIESVYSIKTDKPLLQVVMPLPEFWNDYRNSDMNLPLFRNPEDPAKVISNMLFYCKKKLEITSAQNEYGKLQELTSGNFAGKSNAFINQKDVKLFADNYNLPIVQQLLFEPDFDVDEVKTFPIVIKGLNKNVSHKSELNAVKLDINTKEELINSVKEIKAAFNNSNIELEQFLVQPFIQTNHEILIGGYRDKSFGPIVMFGSGGKYVEVFSDTQIRSAFISKEDAEEMIRSTKIGKILEGVRNEKAIEFEPIINLIISCARLLIENTNVIELDLNPVILDKNNKLHAVDIRIKLS